MNMRFTKEEWDLVVEAIDYRLYCMDQENHFFLEEPGSPYYKLIEMRDYIIAFTSTAESIQ